jgi:hypothetical protein
VPVEVLILPIEVDEAGELCIRLHLRIPGGEEGTRSGMGSTATGYVASHSTYTVKRNSITSVQPRTDACAPPSDYLPLGIAR